MSVLAPPCRHNVLAPGRPGPGDLDLLVVAQPDDGPLPDVEAALALLGRRLRLLTLAAIGDDESAGRRCLAAVGPVPGVEPELVVVTGRQRSALDVLLERRRPSMVAVAATGVAARSGLGRTARRAAAAAGVPLLAVGARPAAGRCGSEGAS